MKKGMHRLLKVLNECTGDKVSKLLEAENTSETSKEPATSKQTRKRLEANQGNPVKSPAKKAKAKPNNNDDMIEPISSRLEIRDLINGTGRLYI